MPPFLADAWAYALAHAPAFLAFACAILPSLITAATEHPDVVPAHALHVLQYLLQILSVLQHKDAEGFFKLPLTTSPSPSDANVLPVQPRGHARIGTLLFMLAAASLLSCAAIHKAFGPSIGDDELACGEAALHEAADKLIPEVTLLLTTGGLDYVDALKALEQTGGDAVKCAVAALVKDFEEQHEAAPEPAQGAQPTAAYSTDLAGVMAYQRDLAAQRGRAYLLQSPRKPVIR